MEAVSEVVMATVSMENWMEFFGRNRAERQQLSKNQPKEGKKSPLIRRKGRADVPALLSAEVPCAMKESFRKSLRAHT